MVLFERMLKEKRLTTMYIANRRDSSKFNGCSSLQLHLGLIGLKHPIAYLPYTKRWELSLMGTEYITAIFVG